MKILNVICPLNLKGQLDDQTCHANLVIGDPLIVSVKHIQNNHIAIYRADYDNKGSHDIKIHALSMALESNNNQAALDLSKILNVSLNNILAI